jgi:hypothetical protein
MKLSAKLLISKSNFCRAVDETSNELGPEAPHQ